VCVVVGGGGNHAINHQMAYQCKASPIMLSNYCQSWPVLQRVSMQCSYGGVCVVAIVMQGTAGWAWGAPCTGGC
jgi:hypothetical protein